jgi:hypothetical protein
MTDIWQYGFGLACVGAGFTLGQVDRYTDPPWWIGWTAIAIGVVLMGVGGQL